MQAVSGTLPTEQSIAGGEEHSWWRCSLFRRDATLKINGRNYTIEKLLGEGGFSFVYLVRDMSSGRSYALKKIMVTTGQEGIKDVMREVEAYRRFRHPNIIKILDFSVVQDEAGEGKIIYLSVAAGLKLESMLTMAVFFRSTLEAISRTRYPPHKSQGIECRKPRF